MNKPDQSGHVSCARPCHLYQILLLVTSKSLNESSQSAALRIHQVCQTVPGAKHQMLPKSPPQPRKPTGMDTGEQISYISYKQNMHINQVKIFNCTVMTSLHPQGERAGRDSQLTSTFRAGRHHGGRLVQDRLLHDGERLEDGVELVH